MNVSSEHTSSLWMDTEVVSESPFLDRNEETDVVIVGSGIAGLSTAYELSSRGANVVVVDRGPIGKGMTARTTAHLTSGCDDGFAELIKVRGEKAARLFYQSHAAAIDRIEAVQKQEKIACNFRRLEGVLFPAPDHDPSELDEELEAAGKVGMKLKNSSGLPFKGLSKLRCLRYPDQATFHPLKYLRGLAQAITARKGRFYAETIVESVEDEKDGVTVRASNGKVIRGRFAVVATNSPINDRAAIHTKQAPYRTYAMTFTIPRGTIPDALYWDTLDPYHYVRLQPGPGTTDYLIVGGADHKTGEADDGNARFVALESWTRNLLPDLGRETHRWSGQVLEPVDYSAFIGRNPGDKRVYVSTGDSGQGMTHGVIASLLLPDLIAKGESRFASLYEPSRKVRSAITTFVSENITPLQNFIERVTPGEIDSLDALGSKLINLFALTIRS